MNQPLYWYTVVNKTGMLLALMVLLKNWEFYYDNNKQLYMLLGI